MSIIASFLWNSVACLGRSELMHASISVQMRLTWCSLYLYIALLGRVCKDLCMQCISSLQFNQSSF